MGTTIERERTAVTAIARIYHEMLQPLLPSDAMCVFATRITSLLLTELRIKHTCSHLDVICMNDEMFECLSTPPDARPETAFECGTLSIDRPLPSSSDEEVDNAFYGHMIIETSNFFVDLTAHQFDLPEQRIVTGSPLVVPLGSLTEPRLNYLGFEMDNVWSVPIERGHYFFRNAMLQDVPRTEAEWGPVPPSWFKVCLDHTKAALDLKFNPNRLRRAHHDSGARVELAKS